MSNQPIAAPSTNQGIALHYACLKPNPGKAGSAARADSFTTYAMLASYCVLTAITRAVFQADTPYYVASILNHSRGRDFAFWDFGHLLWRPATWALLYLIHPVLPRLTVISITFWIMVSANWIAGLGCVLLVAGLVRRFASPWLTVLTTATLTFSQVFLNYVHTGTAYVPGLFFLLLGLKLADLKTRSIRVGWRESAAFGTALAAAVLLWLPYIFALPALFLFPIIISGFNRESGLYVLRAAIVNTVIGLGTYALVAFRLGLSSAAELRLWFGWASHSIDHIRGLPRATFGFVRSWFETGNFGIELRRFFIHDPYAQVQAASLFSIGTLELALTYLFLGAIVFKLVRGVALERRMLLFLTLTFLPVFSFGVHWQGGDMERYLGAFPALLLSGASAMNSRPSTIVKMLGCAFLSVLIVVNLSHDLRWVRDAEDRVLAARLDVLGSIPENSYIVFSPSDPLYEFTSFNSIDPYGHGKHLIAKRVVDIGTSHVTEWRQAFASNSLDAWQNSKEVWIFRGVLDDVPERRWGWIEGIDSLVSWSDIRAFFRCLEISETRGDFVQLPPTHANIDLLQGFVSQNN
jgi:hypothetical protein